MAVTLKRKDKRSHPERILVVMPSWVGDVVMTTPVLRAIRERFASAHITLLIRPNTREVVEGCSWMNDVIEWQPVRKGMAKLVDPLKMAAQIRRGGYDWSVLLSNSFRTALVAWWAGVPRRIGYDRDGRGFLLTDRVPAKRDGTGFALISTVRYYNELVATLGCPMPSEAMELFTTPTDEQAVQQRLEAWGIADHHPLVVINPGASFGPSKLWEPQRYAEVGDRLVDERDARVVVTYGPGEDGLAWRVYDAMKRSDKAYVVTDPPGTLGQLKTLIRRCDLLLNNDTGPRHFAKAFGRPVVTVFGSTHPEWTDTDYAPERKVRIDVDCGPCQEKVCPKGHHECMTGVTVNMVYDAACELLDGQFAKVALPLVS